MGLEVSAYLECYGGRILDKYETAPLKASSADLRGKIKRLRIKHEHNGGFRPQKLVNYESQARGNFFFDRE